MNELSSTLIGISSILIDFGLEMKVLDFCLERTDNSLLDKRKLLMNSGLVVGI